MKLSQKQHKLLNDITAKNIPEINVLGSVQSGKTFTIALGLILYASNLHKHSPDEEFYGAIIRMGFANNKRKHSRTIATSFE